jgi:hydroxymethylpyrimidine/phosphomethylpyrimidine kinase
MIKSHGRVLIIAGSDSGGGAGIQADIKSVTALGGFAMTAVTAITAQNTLGVSGVHPIPIEMVRAQIDAVMDDLGADAWKTGMLGSVEMVETVAAAIDSRAADALVVVDPVMVAKGGHPLLEGSAVAAMRSLMVPRADLIAPNAPEAARLVGFEVEDVEGQLRAGAALLALGAKAALVKGGHIAGPFVRDLLMTHDGPQWFESERIVTRSTHGTGCTLASAAATGLAQGLGMSAAVDRARRYLLAALLAAPDLGKGHGPIGHGVTVTPFE